MYVFSVCVVCACGGFVFGVCVSLCGVAVCLFGVVCDVCICVVVCVACVSVWCKECALVICILYCD